MYAALKPGGRFIVEVPQRGTAVRQLKPTDRLGHYDKYMAVTRRYAPQDQTITEVFRLVEAGKTSHTYTLRYRLYDRASLLALLRAAGFTIQAVYGGYQGAPLADNHAIMLAIGGKEK